ncbi:MAG: TetR/AcrR family transcriptional regulator [Mycobacteriales bacterium]
MSSPALPPLPVTADAGIAARSSPAGARRARRVPRTVRRRQILTAAQDVFVARGYHAAFMDEIADRAGVSKPVLYQHFPGKFELYLALLDEKINELQDAVGTALASTPDNRDRVRACIDAYFTFVDTGGGAFRLVFESDLRQEPAVAERVDRMLEVSVDAIADTITRDTGLPRTESRLLSCALAGLAEVSARWWVSAEDRMGRERAVELLAALAWRGVSGFPRNG